MGVTLVLGMRPRQEWLWCIVGEGESEGHWLALLALCCILTGTVSSRSGKALNSSTHFQEQHMLPCCQHTHGYRPTAMHCFYCRGIDGMHA